jgi:hypothetical protein
MNRVLLGSSLVVALLGASHEAFAADETPRPIVGVATSEEASDAGSKAATDPWATRFSVMAGLGQWVVFGGGNIAAQLKVGRVVFEYSHGQALDYDRLGGFAKTKEERDAGVSLFSPWTTGGGVGFQITPHFHVLVEVKAHRYEVTSASGTEHLSYTTFSIGPGAFYDVYLYEGLFLQPNVRFWPNVGDTLGKSTLTGEDGTTYEHAPHALNFFANMNLGYTFTGI